MSLFDSASLIVTPSGYKEDKLYSIKPTDGSGDLVVTRATTATRVNSAGLIEEVPYNFVSYSQDFTNAAWAKLGTALTVTGNTTIAPDGTLTADTLNVSNNDNILYQANSSGFAFTGNTYTFSIYAKGTGTFDMRVRLNSATTTSQVKTLTNEWQRFEVSVTNSVAVTSVETYLGLNTSSTYFVWGAQLVSGTSAKEYFPTTDRLDIPRLDYTNSSCPSILVEPQRTNLILRSEEFDNASWIKINTTISANAVNSPNGTQSADKVIEDSANGQKYILQQYITAATGFYTFSSYIKADGRNFVRYGMTDGISDAYVDVNLTTKSTANLTTGGAWSGGSVSVTDAANGFLRISFTASKGAGASIFPIIFLCNTLGNSSYLGNGTSGIYIWGAQLEAGAYATSYVPTQGSSVTRNADVISKTGISSLIGQTEGTMFCEIQNWQTQLDKVILALSDGSFSNYLQISSNSVTGDLQSVIFTGGTPGVLGTIVPVIGQNYKIAIGYKLNDYAIYINGTQVGTFNSKAAPSSLTRFDLGSIEFLASNYQPRTPYKVASIWKTRLTNAELAELTTI